MSRLKLMHPRREQVCLLSKKGRGGRVNLSSPLHPRALLSNIFAPVAAATATLHFVASSTSADCSKSRTSVQDGHEQRQRQGEGHAISSSTCSSSCNSRRVFTCSKKLLASTVIVIVLATTISNTCCFLQQRKHRQLKYQVPSTVSTAASTTASLTSLTSSTPSSSVTPASFTGNTSSVTETVTLTTLDTLKKSIISNGTTTIKPVNKIPKAAASTTTAATVTTAKTTTTKTTAAAASTGRGERVTQFTRHKENSKLVHAKKANNKNKVKAEQSQRKVAKADKSNATAGTSKLKYLRREDSNSSNNSSNKDDENNLKASSRADESIVASHYSTTRPFYNIAHMVNSIKEINYYLSRGANAIEADVAFSPNGTALYTFHGYPCDCFRHCTEREDIIKYLEYVREITRPESPYYKRSLALLFLDLKISNLPPSAKAVAGQDMASKIIDHVFQGGSNLESKINILFSIGHIYDSDFILGFQNELESRDLASNLSSRIGWDVGLNDPINTIISMWRRIEVINNIWQGDGRSNCISPFYNLGRLTQVVSRRDERNDMLDDIFIDKVYHWTIDLTHNLRASLRTGVDGIITNHPERLVDILRESEFSSKFRMADQSDSPWERIQSRIDFNPSPAAPPTQPVSARWVAGVGDMVTSFAKYLRDFVFLRVPSYHNIS